MNADTDLVLVRAQLLRCVVQSGVNHAVPDRLSHNVLRVLLVFQLELLADVGDRNARIGYIDFAQPGLDDVVAQPIDQRELPVGKECSLVRPASHSDRVVSFLVPGQVGDASASPRCSSECQERRHATVAAGRNVLCRGLKAREVAVPHRLRELHVRLQRVSQPGGLLCEHRSRRDFSLEQLDNRDRFVDSDAEPHNPCLRRLAQRLLQVVERLGVLQLDGLDPTNVVEVT